MNGETSRDRWWLVAASGIAVFMTQLDATVVNVAIPTIQEGMGIGPSLAATPRQLLGATAATTSLARQLGVARPGTGHRRLGLLRLRPAGNAPGRRARHGAGLRQRAGPDPAGPPAADPYDTVKEERCPNPSRPP
ncbi:hypothetical protein [Nonomuraea diastatica]|uniref:MFS transporter n=1 Tax=Nonomuraea diastatica TaxID=1848329 RepID=A0A4R4X6D7_9ACTN|nr:hypothetical protein [Nonomuraea diastatica]TDD25953.1 hypothetical protein E1294_01500 [Nonomuraea diastatica]